MCEAKKGDIVRPTKRFLCFEWYLHPMEDKEYLVEDVITDDGSTRFIVNGGRFHHSYFTLVKTAEQLAEEQKMSQKQLHKATKRIPFTKDSWKNFGGKVWWKPTNTEVLYFDDFLWDVATHIGVYKAPRCEYVATLFQEGDYPNMEIELEYTSVRIPFDPSRKDSKVFVKNTTSDIELVDWHQMSTGVIVGVSIMDSDSASTNLYHPNDLEMEVEEIHG